MFIHNQTNSFWTYEVYVDSPGGPANWLRSGQYTIAPGYYGSACGATSYNPEVYTVTTWVETKTGLPVTITPNDSLLRWGMVRVYSPCIASAPAGTSIVTLHPGFTGAMTPILYDQNLVPPVGCPNNSSPQIIGDMQTYIYGPNNTPFTVHLNIFD